MARQITSEEHQAIARPVGDRDLGFLLGVLVGEGTFGGDGLQPHITLRMHTRHHDLFRWLQEKFPGGRLYGPYSHSNRHYYQWMLRGPYLRQRIIPLIWQNQELLDSYTKQRFIDMCQRYEVKLKQ